MYLIRKIMVILLLLVGLFVVGMWAMSVVNLNYTKKALAEQRDAFLAQAFNTHFNQISGLTRLFERQTQTLASITELLYQHQQQIGHLTAQDWKKLFFKQLADNPESLGIGVWFAPNAYSEKDKFFGISAIRGKHGIHSKIYRNDDFLYHNQLFYRMVTEQMEEQISRPLFWSAAYPHPLHKVETKETVVVSISVPLFDTAQRFIGVASSDWSAVAISQLIGKIDVTPHSVAFLIDSKNRKLGLSKEKSLFAQNLLSLLNITKLFPTQHTNVLDTALRANMQRKTITVEQQAYFLYYAQIPSSKMVFGISVPTNEINAMINDMRRFNFHILAVTVLILLVLASIILYIVSGIMRLLDTLYTDNLTKKPNRNRLLQDVPRLKPYGVILLNLDNFKEINDFYGNDWGDYVLQQFTQRLDTFLSKEPLPTPVQLYKMPADEWALVLEHSLNEVQLTHFLDDLANFSDIQNFSWEEQQVGISASLGAATADKIDYQHGETLLSAANMALKRARQQKQRVLIYTTALQIRETYEQNLTWAKKLKKAIAQDHLLPFFQPIINVKTQKVEKYECLLRMREEDGTLVSPHKFLPIAKKIRLYPQITRIMVEKSFATFESLPHEFSINLSYEDLSSPETVAFIYQMLQRYDITNQVFFEILESESIANYAMVLDFITTVKKMGCRIAIDDFGSGYSNFEHLLRLQVDMIKIDGSLVRNIDKDPNALIVMEGIVNFAHRLQLQTVAEFVHADVIFAKAAEIGVDYAQGYYIGAPRDAL